MKINWKNSKGLEKIRSKSLSVLFRVHPVFIFNLSIALASHTKRRTSKTFLSLVIIDYERNTAQFFNTCVSTKSVLLVFFDFWWLFLSFHEKCIFGNFRHFLSKISTKMTKRFIIIYRYFVGNQKLENREWQIEDLEFTKQKASDAWYYIV